MSLVFHQVNLDFNGEIKTVEVGEDVSVETLRKIIKENYQTTGDNFELQYCGKTLSKNDSLFSYNLFTNKNNIPTIFLTGTDIKGGF